MEFYSTDEETEDQKGKNYLHKSGNPDKVTKLSCSLSSFLFTFSLAPHLVDGWHGLGGTHLSYDSIEASGATFLQLVNIFSASTLCQALF